MPNTETPDRREANAMGGSEIISTVIRHEWPSGQVGLRKAREPSPDLIGIERAC
jgi:hypothetical protein